MPEAPVKGIERLLLKLVALVGVKLSSKKHSLPDVNTWREHPSNEKL